MLAGLIGGLLAVVVSAILLLVDRLFGTTLIRPWVQLALGAGGVGLLLVAALRQSLTILQRVVLGLGGVLSIATSLDSLDGVQHILSDQVVILSIWSLIFAYRTSLLLRASHLAQRRVRIGLALNILAMLGYLGVAGCAFVLIWMGRPIERIIRVPASTGIVIMAILQLIAPIRQEDLTIRGAVLICPHCGLRNIAARQTCKRCRASLRQ